MDVIQRLRQETRTAHERAERQVVILEANATRAQYRDYLAWMYGFHAGVEPSLLGHDELRARGFERERRGRAPLLRKDLKALGFSDGDVAALPLCADVPELSSLSRAFGVAYVIEGSTLGGQFILRRFPLKELRGTATNFFEAYGEQTGPLWKRFVQLLNDNVPAASADECVGAAVETFEALIRWVESRPA